MQNQQNPLSHNDILERFSKLSSHNDRENLPHEVEATSRLRAPSPTSSFYSQLPCSLARPKRHIKPLQRLFESIECKEQAKKPSLQRHHQENIVNTSLNPPQTMKEALLQSDAKNGKFP